MCLKRLYVGLNLCLSAKKKRKKIVMKSKEKCANVHYKAVYAHMIAIDALGILWNKAERMENE